MVDRAFDVFGITLTVCTWEGRTLGFFDCSHCGLANQFGFLEALEQEVMIRCSACGQDQINCLDPRLRWAWEDSGGF